MGDDDQILIGEGVVLDSGAAPVTLRILSGALDMVVGIVLFVVGFNLLDQVLPATNDAWDRTLVILWTVVCLVVIPTTVETLTRGRSLGRLATGLRIVRDDGGPVSVRHALTRAMLGVLEIYGTFGALAVTVSVFGARGKRIGDHLAGTYAMRTRGSRRVLPPLAMPLGLGAWARTADITRLPDGLALTSRMFLARADRMHLPSRVRLGSMLSDRILTHVSPAPPPGTHPEAFIAAVLTERRDREWVLESARVERSVADGDAMRRLPYGIPDVD